MYILIIINPNSGDKEATVYGDALIEILKNKDLQVDRFETSSQSDFSEVGALVKEKRYDTVAILGGDGTISDFINEIADLEIRPEIMLLPLGTTNNFARALKTELDLDILLDKINKDQVQKKKSDVGKINDNYFISTVSAGSLPETAWKTDDHLKEKFGPFGYVIEGVKTFTQDNSFSLTFKTIEGEEYYDEVYLIVIGLTNSVFGVPTFFRDAEIDDGMFHLFGLKKGDLIEEVSTLANFVLWDEENNDKKDIYFSDKFMHATLTAPSPLNLSVDGEKGPQFPVELEILHNHLTFIVPEKD